MTAIPLTGYALHKSEMEYHGKFGHTLGSIQHITLVSTIDIFMQPIVYQPKLLYVLFIVSYISRSVLNIWLVTHISPYSTLIIIIVAKISSK